ncbi:unnamed protein product, partial [Rotaria sp. Silwood2]
QKGITVAGGNRQGNGINQLSKPWGLYVDDDQTVYVADRSNHRIVEWKWGATSGQVVAGGNGQGNGAHQLSNPLDVIVDKERDSLIICDGWNRRVVRWPRRNGTSEETIISNIGCVGLTMDENGSLYVTDNGKNEVRRYRRGESQGTVVAGGNGSGNRLDQLSSPRYAFIDRDHSVYVSDWGNDRVMKWMEGAKQGIVVAGGQGKGNGLTQLSCPEGVVVDQLGTVYVADGGNDRIMRWPKGATQGSVIVGGNGRGEQSNQLNWPFDFSGKFTLESFRNKKNDGIWAGEWEIIPPPLLNASTDKFKKGIIFWGAISSRGLIPAEGPVNLTKWLHQQQQQKKKDRRKYLTSDLYAKFLQQKSSPAIKLKFKNTNLVPIFQDDQDNKHRTNIIMNTVDTSFDERIDPEVGDAKFADVWPIETVWGAINEKLRQETFENELQLEKRVVKEWKTFTVTKCQQMMEKIPSQLKLVIDQEGEHINGH